MAGPETPQQPHVDNYDVFVSFRGEDTRSGFVSHLYQGLKDSGIHVFLDNEELTYGKRLAEELPQAIVNSKIYIPVLSETYASSKWCLRELAEIVRNEQEFEDKEILPVFYRVTSADVKLKTDVFKKHLSSHKEKESDQTVEEWTKALQCIPERRGFGVPSKSSKGDAEFCQEIVKCVSVMLKVKHKQVPEGLIGMGNPVKEVMKLLDTASPDLQMIGIHGMGGIGKSTLAKVVYNNLCDSFDCCSFLLNVRESLSGKNGDCLELQKKLLKDVSHQEEGGLRDTDDAISTIKRRLQGKRALLVFDDVSEPNQMEMLLGDSYRSFGRGSCIIITTRDDRNVQLKGEGEKVKIYKMEEMKNEDALQLFSWHAFGKLSPPEEYRPLCEDIVSNLTEGLPLSLEVIGSLLYRKTKEAWGVTIQKLRQIPHKDIQKKLMVSYEDLSDEAKEIFLDIACLFVDEERTYEIYMWEACQLFPQLSIEELVSMCLVKVKDDKYWMHDHIKDLGRAVVRQDQARQSRFWIKEDGINILRKRQKEDNNIKAIRLLDLGFDEVTEIWNTKPENFPHLEKLRFLQMEVDQNPEYGNIFDKLNVEGTFEFFLPNLRWLSWYNASSKLFKVTKFNLKELVILDFSYSDIDEEWAGWKELKGLHSLQVLDLTGCDRFYETPDLSHCKSLKRLVLRLCRNLRKINRSIINLKALEYLDFTGCSCLLEMPEEVFSLIHLKEIMGDFGVDEEIEDEAVAFQRIPKSVGQLTSLVTLRLNQSEFIDALPDVIGRLINLRSLDLSSNWNLQSLPDSIGGMVKLESLLLEHCTGLVRLPDSLTSLAKLQRLILTGCCKLKSLPDSVGEMVSLKEVDISYTGLKKLPRFLSMQTKLEKLDAKWTELTEIEELLPTSLVELIISSSAYLQSVPDHLSRLTNLTELKLVITRKSDGSSDEVESPVKGFDLNSMAGKLLKLKKLHLNTQGFTTTTPCEFVNLSQLVQLTLQCSVSETCALANLSNLKEVNMSLYNGTKSLSLVGLNRLVQFHLTECEDLVEIRGLGELFSLESLVISCCSSLERLDDLSELRRLTYLEIKECKRLQIIVGVPNLQSLKKLHIYGCESLQSFSSLSESESETSSENCLEVLRVVRIHNCPVLRDVQCLKGLKSHRKVEISNCPSLEGPFKPRDPKFKDIQRLEDLFRSVERCRIPKELSDLSTLQTVRKIEIIRCETPIEITGLGELQFLCALKIKHCHSIQRLNIDGIRRLSDLYIGYCNNLNDIGSFPDNILSLPNVMIRECPLLSNLSVKAERMIKSMMSNEVDMIVKGFQIDYEPLEDYTDLEEDDDDDDDDDDDHDEEEEEEDDDDDDDDDEEEEEEEEEEEDDDDEDDDEEDEVETRLNSAMDIIGLPKTTSPSPSPTTVAVHPLSTRNDEYQESESSHHLEEPAEETSNFLIAAENMNLRRFSTDMPSASTSSAKPDPSSIYEQLNSLLLDKAEESTPTSPVDTKEAKAVLKRFLSGGIETLEEEKEEPSILTPVLEAAKALSLANPRDSGFWGHFSSKLQLASSFYKLNTEKVKAAEALNAKYNALKESSQEAAARYEVLKNKADRIQASKEKMEFEREKLRAQLAQIEEKVAEADKQLEDVGYECRVVVSEMEVQCEALKATRDEVRSKDAEKATSEGWLMSLKADWNEWRAYLD